MHRAPRTTSRRPLMVATAALLTLSLAACGDDAPASTLDERADWSQLTLPASTQLAGERVSFTTSLGRTGELPWLVAGVGAEPGEVDQARVWTETDDGWSWNELPIGADGDATVSAATTDGAETWVAGWTWTAGDAVQPYLVSSADRREWAPVDLPDDAVERAVQIGDVAPVGDRVLLTGRDASFSPVLVVAGEDGSVLDLPAPPDGRELDGFSGMAASGDVVVAVAGASLPGRASEPLVYTSADAGDTWTVTAGPVTGPAAVYGVAVQDGVFVATGYQSDPAGTSVAAAWSSIDGLTWAPEVLPALDPYEVGFEVAEGENTWLAVPSVGGGRLVAPFATAHGLGYGAMARDAGGAWSLVGYSTEWDVQGVGGTAAAQDDGTVFLAQSTRNGARIGLLTQGGQYRKLGELGTLGDGMDWFFLDPAGTPDLLAHSTVTEVRGKGAWRQTSQLSRYTVDGSAVVDAPWDPVESQQMSTLSVGSDASGATVVLGASMDGFPLGGWFRPGADAPWTPVALDDSGADWIGDVDVAEGTWVATGVRRPDSNVNTQKRAGVWTSTDGVTWTAAEGPFAAAAGDSAASGACALPNGDLLVVGSEDEGAESRPVAWRGAGGQWQRVDPAAFGGAYGSFSSCVTADGRTVVQGSSGGRSTVWSTEDGVTFDAAELGGRGESFGTIRVVEGGFAAAGTRTAEGQRGAVVWLSTDARDWRPVAVPSERTLTGTDVMPDGKGGLLLAAGSAASPELWSLPDYASLFSED